MVCYPFLSDISDQFISITGNTEGKSSDKDDVSGIFTFFFFFLLPLVTVGDSGYC